MSELAKGKCEACRVGAPPVTDAELAEGMAQLPDWAVLEEDGVRKLHRAFAFANWAEAFAFVQRLSAMAEDEGHHPLVSLTWGRVEVWWWTHKIHDLHRNDLIAAAKTDLLLEA